MLQTQGSPTMRVMRDHMTRFFALALVAACGADAPESERSRIFYLPNGSLGKLDHSDVTRAAVDIADDDCTAAAVERGLGGSWRAWLSSSTSDAIDRIGDAAPWYRVDRATLLFATKAELAGGPRVRIEPPREPPAEEPLLFWSGTSLDGTRTTATCDDWRAYLKIIGTVGRADAAGGEWAVQEPHLCSNYLALLCIEQ
jgi:hypothetical protein